MVAIGGVASYRGHADPGQAFPQGLPVPTPKSALLVQGEEGSRFAYLIAVTEEAVLRVMKEATTTPPSSAIPMYRAPISLFPGSGALSGVSEIAVPI